MRRFFRLVSCFLVVFCILGAAATRAAAFEIAGTVAVGAFQVGTTTRFAVVPGLSLRLGGAEGLNLSIQDSLVLFPEPGPFGFNNQTTVGVGYAGKSFDVDLAASLAAYWMYVCGDTLCGRVVGAAPGARARVAYFPFGFAGVAVTGDIGWYGGSSLVLPSSLAVTLTAGPILRWKSEK